VNAGVALRDLGPITIGSLADRVSALPESAWDEDPYRQQTFDVHQETRSIRLVWTPLDPWPDVEARTLDACAPFEADLQRVYLSVALRLGRPTALMNAVLARLDPGRRIARHVDSAPFFARCHRVHLPLLTQPGAVLEVDGTEHHLAVGGAYEVNNRRPHAAANRGPTPRVHLILDLAA
jgi:hypothetical protein